MPEASRRTIALDPDTGKLPEGLLLPPEQGGEVVAFIVDPGVRDWAPTAVFALARGWAGRGRRCLVVDADFAGPTLPPGSSVAPREGLSDLLFYGASIERVAITPRSEPFDLVPAGTVVPDAAHAWAHEAWAHLLAGLRSDHRVVLLLLPGNREGVAPLTARADRVFRLGLDPAEGPDAFPLIHPASHAVAAPAARTPEPLNEPQVPPRATRPVDGLTRADQASLASKTRTAPRPSASFPEGDRDTDVSPSAAPPPRRPLPWLLLVLLLLVLGLLGAAWLGWLEIPGLDLPGRTAFTE